MLDPPQAGSFEVDPYLVVAELEGRRLVDGKREDLVRPASREEQAEHPAIRLAKEMGGFFQELAEEHYLAFQGRRFRIRAASMVGSVRSHDVEVWETIREI